MPVLLPLLLRKLARLRLLKHLDDLEAAQLLFAGVGLVELSACELVHDLAS